LAGLYSLPVEFIGKKISIVRKPEEISIVISASERKSASNALLFWLVCWLICGPLLCFLLLDNPAKETKIFLFIFGAFWLYYLVRVYLAFMWKRYGREVIKIREGKIFIKKDIRKKGKVHVYELGFVKDLRKREVNLTSIGTALGSADWLTLKETIAFDYYGKEIRFGYELKDEDANDLLKLVRYQLGKARREN
jgi:hypothetical protein